MARYLIRLALNGHLLFGTSRETCVNAFSTLTLAFAYYPRTLCPKASYSRERPYHRSPTRTHSSLIVLLLHTTGIA